MTAEFADATFDIEDGCYVVKSDLRRRVVFAPADALDPGLKDQIGTSDIVYAQNLLLHLRPRAAKAAFRNICRLLNPKAALFVAGVDLPLLQAQTRKRGLVPLDYRIEEIYGEMRGYSDGWPWHYHARRAVPDGPPRMAATVFDRLLEKTVVSRWLLLLLRGGFMLREWYRSAAGRHRARSLTPYVDLWCCTAAAVSAEFVALPGGLCELRLGERTTRTWDQLVMLDDPVTLRIAGDKALSISCSPATASPCRPTGSSTGVGSMPPMRSSGCNANPAS